MIRHIVMFTLKDFDEAEKVSIKLKIKNMLEGLKDIIPGIVKLDVVTDPLPTTDGDVVLDSIFESEEALANYQVRPEHKKAGEYIGTVRKERICIDYYEL
jgi:heme-degrading monooxygenase HmoA